MASNPALPESSPSEKRPRRDFPARPSTYEELFHLLRTRPPEVVTEIVRCVCEGADAQSVVRHVHDGDLFIQLAVQPDVRCHHPLPYIADLRPLFSRARNPYVGSHLFTALFGDDNVTSSPEPRTQLSRKPSLYDIPYHAARILDTRLRSPMLRLSRWSSVSTDDAFLRRLLEMYFQFEYPFYSFFHKGIFLNDLIAGRTDFCSSFMVNSILTIACVLDPDTLLFSCGR